LETGSGTGLRTGSENTEDPVVVRRRGPAVEKSYAVYAAELLLPVEEPELDDFESADEEVVDGVDGFESEDVDGFDVAGELLDEEPRLSFR
jgi:hypothetical protein